MFAQTFVNTQASTRKPWTVALSFGIQSIVVGALLLIPLLHPEILQPRFETPVWVPLKLAPDPPQPKVVKPSAAPRASARPVFTAPAAIPRTIAKIVDAPAEAPEAPGIYIPGASAMGIAGVPIGTLPFALPDKAPESKPVAIPKPRAPEGPMHVSSGVQAAKLITGIKPPYPALAKAARVQGIVKLQATIGADGRIAGLKVVSGPPLLVNAAVEAVSKWRYQPTLLNNAPVEVLTEIDVIFTLN